MSISSSKALITSKPVSTSHASWHHRLGHVAEKAVKATLDYYSIPTLAAVGGEAASKEASLCEPCLKGGRVQSSFGHHQKATKMLERVHLDLIGPMEVATAAGKQYILTIVEETSGLVAAKPLKLKSDARDEIIQWIVWAERRLNCKLKALQSDRGGEFVNNSLGGYLKEQGIEHRLSIAGTPQQNGIAERANRTLIEMARAMLVGAACPHSLWGEAVVYASHVLNAIKREGRRPAAERFNLKPHLPDFHPFGCTAWARAATPQGKLGDRSLQLFFAGFTPGVKGWRLLDRQMRVRDSRDVVFDDSKPYWPFADGSEHVAEEELSLWQGAEIAALSQISPSPLVTEGRAEIAALSQGALPMPTEGRAETAALSQIPLPTLSEQEAAGAALSQDHSSPLLAEQWAAGAAPSQGDDAGYETTSTLTSLSSEEESEAEEESTKRTRSGRQVKEPGRLQGFERRALITCAAEASKRAEEPQTVAQARERHDWPLWEAAIEKEIENHRRNQTWRMEPLPKGRSWCQPSGSLSSSAKLMVRSTSTRLDLLRGALAKAKASTTRRPSHLLCAQASSG